VTLNRHVFVSVMWVGEAPKIEFLAYDGLLQEGQS